MEVHEDRAEGAARAGYVDYLLAPGGTAHQRQLIRSLAEWLEGAALRWS